MKSKKTLAQLESSWAREKDALERIEKIKYEKKHIKRSVKRALGDSYINYFSDLFIVVMVLGWAMSIPIVAAFAVYATIILRDTSLWVYFTELVTVPLTAGGAIWMLKNAVQHAITNYHGKKCDSDFPRVEGTDYSIDNEVVLSNDINTFN